MHIESLVRLPSHYSRKDTTREYLDASLNLRKLYDEYINWCKERNINACKSSLYGEVFHTEYNIFFHKPKKDQCEFCTTYTNSNAKEKEELQTKFDVHIRNKERAQAAKQQEKLRATDDRHCVAAIFDLEQVLECPSLEVSVMFYKRKLSVYNLTVYELGNGTGHCYMWHEGQAKRGGNDITTAVYKFALAKAELGVREIHFFSDQCIGQNKNQFVSFMYYLVTTTTAVSCVTHSFFEPGHSMNEGDSMHSAIESAKKNMDIYCPEQYYFLVRRARRGNPYVVNEMCTDDFIDFEAMSKSRKLNWKINEDKERINWRKIRVLHFDSIQHPDTMLYTTDYDDAYCSVPLFPKKNKQPKNLRNRSTKCSASDHITSATDNLTSSVSLLKRYTEPPGISAAKYKDLISLCETRIIKATYHQFYRSLPITPENEKSSDSDME